MPKGIVVRELEAYVRKCTACGGEERFNRAAYIGGLVERCVCGTAISNPYLNDRKHVFSAVMFALAQPPSTNAVDPSAQLPGTPTPRDPESSSSGAK